MLREAASLTQDEAAGSQAASAYPTQGARPWQGFLAFVTCEPDNLVGCRYWNLPALVEDTAPSSFHGSKTGEITIDALNCLGPFRAFRGIVGGGSPSSAVYPDLKAWIASTLTESTYRIWSDPQICSSPLGDQVHSGASVYAYSDFPQDSAHRLILPMPARREIRGVALGRLL